MINKEKLNSYLRANGGLNKSQAMKFFFWSFFNIKKCFYFYKLCEEGYSNFVAFNMTDKASSEKINNYK
jgi:hypothetical protein